MLVRTSPLTGPGLSAGPPRSTSWITTPGTPSLWSPVLTPTPSSVGGPMCTVSDGCAGADLVGDGQRVVDRDGEALAAGSHPEVDRRGGGHADDLTGAVDHRAAGIAGAHRGRELDEPGDFVGAAGQLVLRR